MKRIFKAYKELISILFSESPWIVILTFLATIIDGTWRPIPCQCGRRCSPLCSRISPGTASP